VLRFGATLLAAILSTEQSVAEDACAPVLAVSARLNATKEFRSVSTYPETTFQVAGTEEYIFFQWKYYSRWNDGPWVVRRRESTGRDPILFCRRHADEIIDGIPTITVHYMRERGDGHLLSFRTNISKSTGLPVRTRYALLGPYYYNFWTAKFDFEGPFVDPVLNQAK